MSTPYAELVINLVALGFSEPASIAALKLHNNDVEQAANFLLAGGTTSGLGQLDSLSQADISTHEGAGPASQAQVSPVGPAPWSASQAVEQVPPLVPANSLAGTSSKAPLMIDNGSAAQPDTIDLTGSNNPMLVEERNLQEAMAASLRDQQNLKNVDTLAKREKEREEQYEAELQQALALSYGTGAGGSPLNPVERQREKDLPVGLKNVGNTCYVNTLLQLYYSLSPLRYSVLNFRPSLDQLTSAIAPTDTSQEATQARQRALRAMTFGEEVQELFAFLSLSSQKFIDPSRVLKALVNENGDPVEIGNQQDVSEFNLTFLELLDDALSGPSYTSARGTTKRALTAPDLEDTRQAKRVPMDVDGGDLVSPSRPVRTGTASVSGSAADPADGDGDGDDGDGLTGAPASASGAQGAAGTAGEVDPEADGNAMDTSADSTTAPTAPGPGPMTAASTTTTTTTTTTTAAATADCTASASAASAASGNATATVAASSPTGAAPADAVMTEGAAPTKPSIVKALFYGEESQVVQFENAEGEKEILRNDGPFAQLIINVAAAGGDSESLDLYASLDYYTAESEIEYKLPSGAETTAVRSISFNTLPPVLTFQIQRVDFHRERQQAIKVNTPLYFEKELFMDRYVTENREEVAGIRRKNARTIQKRDDLRSRLKYLENYADSGVSLSKVLDTSAAYFYDPAISSYYDHGLSDREVDKLHRLLKKHQSLAAEQVTSLQEQVQGLSQQVRDSFDRLRKHRYRLHGVLVHAGQATSGHYWAYLYDAPRDRWFKYNDTECTQVDEAEVIATSTGCDDNAGGRRREDTNAYCIVYMQESLEEAGYRRRLLAEQRSNEAVATLRVEAEVVEKELIPENLVAKIEEDAATFQTEVLAYQVQEQRTRGINMFVEKLSTACAHLKAENARVKAAEGAHNVRAAMARSLYSFLSLTGSNRLAYYSLAEYLHTSIFNKSLEAITEDERRELRQATTEAKMSFNEVVLEIDNSTQQLLGRRKVVFSSFSLAVYHLGCAIAGMLAGPTALSVPEVLNHAVMSYILVGQLPHHDSFDGLMQETMLVLVIVVLAAHRQVIGLLDAKLYDSGIARASRLVQILSTCLASQPAGSDAQLVYEIVLNEWIEVLESLQAGELSETHQLVVEQMVLQLTSESSQSQRFEELTKLYTRDLDNHTPRDATSACRVYLTAVDTLPDQKFSAEIEQARLTLAALKDTDGGGM